MKIECDVLVVGGGPAGSSAARATAKKGLKTILIEEDKEIGVPVQCAEAIGSYLIPCMPCKIPKKLLIWKINGMYFWANNIVVKKEGGIWSGYSINRRQWDQWLSLLAVKEGVKILTDTKLTSFEFDREQKVQKVLAIKNGKSIEFMPRYVIGADGVHSTVLECLGEKKKVTLGHVKSYEMKKLKLDYPRYEQLFFGDFAPGAYAYIFPLSKTTANLGVGSLQERNMDNLFNEFKQIPIVKRQIFEGKILIEKSGDAPIRNLSNKLVYGNVFLVGDAANQNIKPFLEGIVPSIICGNLLGNLIYNIFQKKDTFDRYEEIIEKKISAVKESQKYADFVFQNNFIENRIFPLILFAWMIGVIVPEKDEIEKAKKGGYEYLKKLILKNGGFIEK